MPGVREVRTSLEVGFPPEGPPERLLRHRGRAVRSIPAMEAFPFEDEQFDAVLMDGSVVGRASVREAHRVLRPEGRLHFIVPERTGRQAGYTLPDIYSVVRDGFSIVTLERSAWWFLRRVGRTLAIVAQKKASWKAYRGLAGDGTFRLSPFRDRP